MLTVSWKKDVASLTDGLLPPVTRLEEVLPVHPGEEPRISSVRVMKQPRSGLREHSTILHSLFIDVEAASGDQGLSCGDGTSPW